MLFKIDFTRPHLYEDVVTLNQGNLSTNNTLRCRIVTGGNDDVTGASIVCTFVINGKQVFESGKVVDGPRGIVDVVFPSEALVVGENTLEFLVNRIDGSVAQSPVIKYRVWQGLTTDEGVRADSNYPLLVELINQANSAVNSANEALEGANSVIAQGDELKASVDKLKADCIASVNSFTEENSAKIDNAISQNVAKVDAAIVKNEASVVKADAAAEKAILAANNSDTKTAENIKNVNAAIAAGTQDLEVKAARVDMDGVEHGSLKERLESDLKKGKLIEETKEGTYLSFNDTVAGLVSDIEVFGNTVQDASNLANIRSSCIPNGDGTFKMSILSCGNNLCNNKFKFGELNDSDGNEVAYDGNTISSEFSVVKGGNAVIIKSYDNTSTYARMFEYDKSGKVVTSYSIASLGTTSKTLNENTKYIKLKYQGKQSNIKVQLEEGTVATPYTPYEETRCDIKLPCQLEKWDKLYFDNVENAWVVDKWTLKYSPRNQHYTIASLENVYRCFPSSPTLENIEYKNDYGKATTICKGLPFIQDNYFARDEEHYYIDPNSKREYLFFNKNKFDGTSDSLNKYFESIDFYMLIKLASPQRIVLPQSEQIKLNSFANKTHIYTISGEVDATVKATVSKSLASTAQANTNEINILNDKIADIQGLKESQDFAYETDKGYLVCKDTQNGVVKDLKISGKSLVNDGGIVNKEFTQFSVILNSKKMLTPNKEYTLIIENKTNTDLIVYTAEEAIVPTQNINLKANSTTMKKIVSQSTINSLRLLKSNTPNSNLFNLNVLLLEGDHTQDPPQYFEGIASVGNSNGIEASSTNSNLFDGELRVAHLEGGTNIYREDTVNTLSAIIKIPCGGTYYCKCEDGNRNSVAYFKNKPQKGDLPLKAGADTITVDSGGYLVFYMTNQSNILYPKNIMVNFGNIAKPYTPHKRDRKPILFKDTDGTWKPVTELRGIDANSCDILDSTANKLYRKYINVLLNGSEDISTYGELTTNTIGFKINSITNFKPLGLMISDKLRYLTPQENIFASDIECISMTQTSFVIRISKSKLETQDVTGFKKWLQSNPVTVMYQLAQEKIYEVNPLDLQSFENETMILFGSGVIAPYASWKITSSLPNFVQNIEDRVCRLENDAYKVNLANFAVALNMLDMKARLESLEAPIN